jgi:hypothetical protein
MTDLKISQLPV